MIVHFADGHVHMANKKLDVYNFSVGYSPLSSLLPSVCVCLHTLQGVSGLRMLEF